MTDRIQKSLDKLSEKERQKLKEILVLTKIGKISDLDIKKS